MPTHDQMLHALRAGGRRITSQRETILEVLEASSEHHDAEAVYREVQQRDASISLSTVYRTLTVLKDAGLIETRYVAPDHAREQFEPVNAPEHHHFTCLGCHTVVEFQTSLVTQLRAELERQYGLAIAHACICLEGYCPACAEQRPAQN